MIQIPQKNLEKKLFFLPRNKIIMLKKKFASQKISKISLLNW